MNQAANTLCGMIGVLRPEVLGAAKFVPLLCRVTRRFTASYPQASPVSTKSWFWTHCGDVSASFAADQPGANVSVSSCAWALTWNKG